MEGEEGPHLVEQCGAVGLSRVGTVEDEVHNRLGDDSEVPAVTSMEA